MADSTNPQTEVQTEVPDASKGSVLPTADGGITLDAGSKNRDALPSPVENRDTIRNSDDSLGSDDAVGVQAIDQEALGKATWQIGNFDSSGVGGNDILSNLAYPSAKAVRAQLASDERARGGSVIGGAENTSDDDPVTEKNDDRDSTGLVNDAGSTSVKTVASDVNGDGQVDSWEGVPESELTPAQKRARTIARKKDEEEAAKSGTTDSVVPPLGDPAPGV